MRRGRELPRNLCSVMSKSQCRSTVTARREPRPEIASVLLARETVAAPQPGLRCRSRGFVLHQLGRAGALIVRVIVKPDEAVDLRRVAVGQLRFVGHPSFSVKPGVDLGLDAMKGSRRHCNILPSEHFPGVLGTPAARGRADDAPTVVVRPGLVRIERKRKPQAMLVRYARVCRRFSQRAVDNDVEVGIGRHLRTPEADIHRAISLNLLDAKFAIVTPD